MKKHILSVLVENKPGVLNRVVSLFRRRNFNIDSLTVGRTHRAELSRMTILMEGAPEEARRVEKNLFKLVNVVEVEHLSDRPAVTRDLVLIKARVNNETRSEVMSLCQIFRARIVDVAPDSVVIETTGEEEKVEGLIELLRPLGIIEMVRTGVVALGRGKHTLKSDSYRPQGRRRHRKTVI
ncbi:MAG: acetolactate synthase small subunit [Acidobacteriota bacterium]